MSTSCPSITTRRGLREWGNSSPNLFHVMPKRFPSPCPKASSWNRLSASFFLCRFFKFRAYRLRADSLFNNLFILSKLMRNSSNSRGPLCLSQTFTQTQHPQVSDTHMVWYGKSIVGHSFDRPTGSQLDDGPMFPQMSQSTFALSRQLVYLAFCELQTICQPLHLQANYAGVP